MSNHTPPTPAEVPQALRIGAAFIAVAFVFIVSYAMIVLTQGFSPQVHFAVTPSFLLTVAAAAIVGYFFSVSPSQRNSRSRAYALGVAIALIIISRLFPRLVLLEMETFWLMGYAVACGLAGFILRRRLIAAKGN